MAQSGTAGFGGEDAYFAQLLGRAKALLPTDNRVLPGWMCQGRMPAAVRARYEAMAAAPGDAKTAALLDSFDAALAHPDEADLLAARAWALARLQEAQQCPGFPEP